MDSDRSERAAEPRAPVAAPAHSAAQPPVWVDRAEFLSLLADCPDPRTAGRLVWDRAEPWVGAVRALAAGADVLVAEAADWVALLDRHSTAEVREVPEGARIVWGNVEGVPADPAECEFRLGALEGLLGAAPHPPRRVRHVRCRARADRACFFVVERCHARADARHARMLREAALMAGALQARESIFRRMARVSARSDPFPDVRDLRAVRRFMEELEDPILILDRDLSVVDANQAALELSSLSLDEMRGLSLRDLVSGPSVDRLRAALPELLQRGSLRGVVIDVRTREGWAKLDISARMSGDRQIVACVARDVGERLRLEAELEERNRLLQEQNRRMSQADQLKSEFLANVSHELTTPITCIKGFTRLLLSDVSGEERGEAPRLEADKRIEFLRIMEREAERMTDLIRGLLELSRIESGAVSLDRTQVSLNTIVRETLMVLKPRLEGREIEMELDPELPTALLDPDRMKQVALNLVENAIKFSDSGTSIRIRTGQVGRHLRLSLRNSARALETSDLTRIFERFVQRDGTLSREHGGVGLGLNLVRAIVELHGGRVWGEIPEPGQVEFVAEVPLEPSPRS